MTWLKSVGEWHQKMQDWALEDGISAWKVLLRSILFIVVDAIFKLIIIYGSIVMFCAVFGRFIFKNVEENTED